MTNTRKDVILIQTRSILQLTYCTTFEDFSHI